MQKNILIEKFLREELSEEELIEFHELWDNDPAFVKEVRDYSRLKVALKAADRLGKNSIGRGIVRYMKTAFFKYQSVAAIMLLAIMLPLYLLLQGQKRAITPESPEVTVLTKAQFIKPEERLTADVALKSVWEAYQKGQSEMALKKLEKTVGQSDNIYPLLRADLHFETGQLDSALHYYKIGLIHQPLDSTAKWNSLMTSLLVGDFTETKEDLRNWAQIPNSAYGQRANQLLMAIE